MTAGSKKRHADRVPTTPELDAIGALFKRRQGIDEELKAAVGAARAAGASWSQVGRQLESSKKSVQRKYGHGDTDD